MSNKSYVIGFAVIGTMACAWYLALGHHREPRDAKSKEPSDLATATIEASSSQPSEAAAGPAEVAPAAADGLEAITEEERDAREFARGPIADQPQEQQEQYYKQLSEANANSEVAKAAAIARLEAAREAASPVDRAAFDEAIRVRQKVMQDRARDLAFANAQLPPTQ